MSGAEPQVRCMLNNDGSVGKVRHMPGQGRLLVTSVVENFLRSGVKNPEWERLGGNYATRHERSHCGYGAMEASEK
jgi:hypothetical protein